MAGSSLPNRGPPGRYATTPKGRALQELSIPVPLAGGYLLLRCRCCLRMFETEAAFLKHWMEDTLGWLRCLTAEEMTQWDMHLGDRGWTLGRTPIDDRPYRKGSARPPWRGRRESEPVEPTPSRPPMRDWRHTRSPGDLPVVMSTNPYVILRIFQHYARMDHPLSDAAAGSQVTEWLRKVTESTAPSAASGSPAASSPGRVD